MGPTSPEGRPSASRFSAAISFLVLGVLGFGHRVEFELIGEADHGAVELPDDQCVAGLELGFNHG